MRVIQIESRKSVMAITMKIFKKASLLVLVLVFGALIFLWNQPKLIAEFASKPLNYQPVAIPSVEMTCFKQTLPMNWSYCINKVPKSASKTIIYHFHGRRGNETWWNDDTYYSGDVYRSWELHDIEEPTVVSISFGPLWFLKKEELLDFFVDVVMPKVESQLGTEIEKRRLVGESMGGVNAISAVFNTRDIFDKAASLCPILPVVSPYSSYIDIFQHIENSETTWHKAALMIFIGRYLFPTEQSWEDNNPMNLVSNAAPVNTGDLYLSCGEKDEWGCMDGSLQLVELAKDRGLNIEWEPRPGGHCDIDSESLAIFLGGSPIEPSDSVI